MERTSTPGASHGDAEKHAHRGGGQHGGQAGHGDHAAGFRRGFWAALVLTAPVLVWAETLQHWLGYTAPTFPGSGLLAPVLGSAVFLYGGWPFLTGRWSEARARRPGMMLPGPLAAGVLAWAGFVLPMSVGAALMSLSTIIVAVNAQLLRRVELRPQPT